MPFCNQCGGQIATESRFCSQCGSAVKNIQADVEAAQTDAGRSAGDVFTVIQSLNGVDQKLLRSPQISYLATVLDEHEMPECIVSVSGSECLVATDRRIIHIQNPVFSSGFKSENFPYGDVLSIESHKLFRSQLTIHFSTGKSKTIAGIDSSRSWQFADFVNSKLMPTGSVVSSPSPSPSQPGAQPKVVPPPAAKPPASANNVQHQQTGHLSKEESINAALRRIDGYSRFLSRGEIKELPFILWEDELPEMLAEGSYHDGRGLLVATDRRLIFIDKGLFGQLKVEDFGYDRITSIESKTGLMSGSIVIYASGNREQIDAVAKQNVNSLASYIRNKIHNPNPAPPTPPAGAVSAAEELARYSVLLNNGVITQEEFDSVKARLLGS